MSKAQLQKEPSGKLSLTMRCAECLHFKTGPKSANPAHKTKCSDGGRQGYSKACEYFTPDFTQLNQRNGGNNVAAQVAKLAKDLSPAQKKILGMLLTRGTSRFKKLELQFGQPMWLYLEPTIGLGRPALEMLKGEDLHYLDQYYKAYVVGVNVCDDGVQEIYLASSVKGKPDYYVTVNVRSGEKNKVALTREEFKERTNALKAEGKVRMPKKLRKLLQRLHDMPLPEPETDSSVLTIDDIPSDWFGSSHNIKDKKVRLHSRKKLKHKEEADKNLRLIGSGKKRKTIGKGLKSFTVTARKKKQS